MNRDHAALGALEDDSVSQRGSTKFSAIKDFVSLDQFTGALARAIAFINRGILRYAHWTRHLTAKGLWWVVCLIALGLSILAASSYDAQPLFGQEVISPQYMFGIQSVPDGLGVVLRMAA